MNPEALRTWVKRVETDEGLRPGTTTGDVASIAQVEREVRELRRSNQICEDLRGFFRGGVRPPTPMSDRVAYIEQHKAEYEVEPFICSWQDPPAQVVRREATAALRS